jgi:hypothetical protein
MTAMMSYWTLVVAFFTIVWTLITLIREQKTLAVSQSGSIMARLIESDRLIVEHPEIQRYLAKTATMEETFFRSPAVLDDNDFIKSKSYLYSKLNSFDEILSVSRHGKLAKFLLAPPKILEMVNWEAYMIQRLKHPLCRSIMKNELTIFGGALQDFWKDKKAEIESSAPDMFSW